VAEEIEAPDNVKRKAARKRPLESIEEDDGSEVTYLFRSSCNFLCARM